MVEKISERSDLARIINKVRGPGIATGASRFGACLKMLEAQRVS